jgi:hypothetical protein
MRMGPSTGAGKAVHKAMSPGAVVGRHHRHRDRPRSYRFCSIMRTVSCVFAATTSNGHPRKTRRSGRSRTSLLWGPAESSQLDRMERAVAEGGRVPDEVWETLRRVFQGCPPDGMAPTAVSLLSFYDPDFR